MPFEIRNEADLAAIDEAVAGFADSSGGGSRLIQRVEDVLPVESYAATQIQWIVENVVAEATVTALSGDSGAGKSTFVTAMAHAISRGVPFLGRPTAKRPILILDAENPMVAVAERLVRLRAKTGENFIIWGQWVPDDPPVPGSLIVQEWVARCDPKPVIVADSLIAFHPGSENDASETRRYMDSNYRALTKLGATPIVIHHLGRDTTKDFRGSSDVKGSIDVGFKLTNLGDGSRLSALELRAFKQRFAVTPRLCIQYRDGVFTSDEQETVKTVEEQLADLLRQNPGASGEEFDRLAIERGLGRNRARRFLTDGARSGMVYISRPGSNRRLHTWIGAAQPEFLLGETP